MCDNKGAPRSEEEFAIELWNHRPYASHDRYQAAWEEALRIVEREQSNYCSFDPEYYIFKKIKNLFLDKLKP